MTARQKGIPLSDLLQLLRGREDDPEVRKVLNTLILSAYGTRRHLSTAMQELVIQDFADKVGLICNKQTGEL